MLKESNAGEQRLMPPEQRSFRSESVFAQNAPRYLRRRTAGYDLWPALSESRRDVSLGFYRRQCCAPPAGVCTCGRGGELLKKDI